MTVNGRATPHTYDYGTAQHQRLDFPDGTKRMWWEPGGISMASLPLWNADLLEEHRRKRPDEPVLFVEGEKAADAAVRCGYTAVTNPGGSSQRDFGDALKALTGLKVVLIPDLDDPGGQLMDAVATAVSKEAVEVRRGTVDTFLSDKGADVADLLGIAQDERQAAAMIRSIIDDAVVVERPKEPPKPQRIKLYAAADLMAMELEPVPEPVPGLFLAGHTILSGAPKMGKSFVIESIAVGKAGGRPVLGKIIPESGPVLWMPLEDGLRRTVNRLRQYLADMPAPENLTVAFDWPGLSDGGLQYIEAWLEDHAKGTVLIDTGKRLWTGDEDARGNGSMADYNFIGPLTDLYRDHDAFGLTVWHDRKLMASDFFDQISATRGMTANVDGVANLARERGSKDAKLSIGHRDGEDKAFSLHWDDMIFNWLLVEQVDVASNKASPRVRVLMAIRKLDSDLGVEPSMIVAEVGDMSIATVRNHITELKKEGAIVASARGRVRPAPDDDDE